MVGFHRRFWFNSALVAAGLLLAGWAGAVRAQWGGPPPSSQFELSDAVQLDQADNAVLAQLERVKTLLADRQWDEAIEILRQLPETSEGKLMAVAREDTLGWASGASCNWPRCRPRPCNSTAAASIPWRSNGMSEELPSAIGSRSRKSSIRRLPAAMATAR